MARFPSTAIERAASLRASSSVSRCVFLASVYCLTSFVRNASENYAFPKGERPNLGRCGSSDRRRGVDSRSPVEDDTLEGGVVWGGGYWVVPAASTDGAIVVANLAQVDDVVAGGGASGSMWPNIRERKNEPAPLHNNVFAIASLFEIGSPIRQGRS